MKRLLSLWLHQDAVLRIKLDQPPMEDQRDTLFKVSRMIVIENGTSDVKLD